MTMVRCGLPSLFLLAGFAALAPAQQAAPPAAALTAAQAQALVVRALANELRAAQNASQSANPDASQSASQDASQPMRYQLRKTTPRLTATREIYETKDGDVARLVSIDDQPLSADADARELARLNELENNPGRQRHRKQAEDADTARALDVLRMLPSAFLYQYAGPAPVSGLERFTFHSNPKFNPPDLETQVLTAMSGEIWIDPAQQRVTRLAAHLDHDVDFGWGILGRLYKGGWITIDQAEVEPGVWRIVRLQMAMSARVVWKTRNFDTTEEESQFAPLPAGLDYRQAIEMLKSGHGERAQK